MVNNLGEVLGHMLGVGSSQADDRSATSIYNVNTNDHSVFHIIGDVYLVEVLTDFRVDLFEDVRVNSDLGSVDCGAKDELRSDIL